MVTNVYIDGFNLFHGCLQRTPYRWLDPIRLIAYHFPQNRINIVRFFTAPVQPPPHDADQRNRQEIYWRALRTIPNLYIHNGHFQVQSQRMKLLYPLQDGSEYVEVIKSEEKGSDVNLASYLLVDTFGVDEKTKCEAVIVVSNDADLATPLKLARQKFKIKAAVLHPLRRNLDQLFWPSNCIPPNATRSLPHASIELKRTGARSVEIDETALICSQFDDIILDQHGTIHKPASWY